MPYRKRLTAAQEAKIVADYRRWQSTRQGTAAGVFARNGVSREGGYNVLRRLGVPLEREVRASTRATGRLPTDDDIAIVRALLNLARAVDGLVDEVSRLREVLGSR